MQLTTSVKSGLFPQKCTMHMQSSHTPLWDSDTHIIIFFLFCFSLINLVISKTNEAIFQWNFEIWLFGHLMSSRKRRRRKKKTCKILNIHSEQMNLKSELEKQTWFYKISQGKIIFCNYWSTYVLLALSMIGYSPLISSECNFL